MIRTLALCELAKGLHYFAAITAKYRQIQGKGEHWLEMA